MVELLAEKLTLTVANDLADMRYEHFMEEKAIRLAKESMTSWTELMAEQLAVRLSPALRNKFSDAWLRSELEASMSLFKGLETPQRELKQLAGRVNYIKPVRRTLGSTRLTAKDDNGFEYQRCCTVCAPSRT